MKKTNLINVLKNTQQFAFIVDNLKKIQVECGDELLVHMNEQ